MSKKITKFLKNQICFLIIKYNKILKNVEKKNKIFKKSNLLFI